MGLKQLLYRVFGLQRDDAALKQSIESLCEAIRQKKTVEMLYDDVEYRLFAPDVRNLFNMDASGSNIIS